VLVILTLQVYLDETMEHFNLPGIVDLQGSSALNTINHQFQHNHDHLWLPAAGICVVKRKEQVVKQNHQSVFFIFPEFSKQVWQPPKLT